MVLKGLKTGSGSYGEEILTVARNRSQAPAAIWQEEERFDFPIDHSWEMEAAEFVAALKGHEKQTHGTIEDALEVMKLVDSIYAHDTHVADVLHNDLQSEPI